MENVRIAVLNAQGSVCAFMDNDVPDALHFYSDELHCYLEGSANTFSFTASARHADSKYLADGNKLAFRYRNKDYYLNIVSERRTEQEVEIEAYASMLELINEDVGAYSADRAMTFAEYLEAFDAEGVVELGLNEVSDKSIKNEWTGSSTILARLFSLANVFNAEIEFAPELNRDYSLKRMALNVYRENGGECQGIGRRRNDVTLRYGENVEGVTKTSSSKELRTAIRPEGTDGLTVALLDKEELDGDGNVEFLSPAGDPYIYAVQARDRFPSNLLDKGTDRYIKCDWSYETENAEVLYGQALAELKKLCEPEVSYDIDGYFDTDIGDTVNVADEEYRPALYLEARVTEQVRSFTDPGRNKTVFGNYRELQTQIDPELLARMNALIEENKIYTSMISTDNGTVFKNSGGSTTLTANVRDAGEDVTEKFTIQWKKDGVGLAVGRSIIVNASDVDGKAVYGFDAYDGNNKIRGSYEVTITDVADGLPSYIHIAYADSADGTAGFSLSGSGKKYMGLYADGNLAESSDPSSYQWSLIRGEDGRDGENGTPGKAGENGKTPYFHIAYANSADGTTGFSVTDGADKQYMGTYADFTEADSTDPAKYSWTKIKGDPGATGNGISSVANKYAVSSSNSTAPTSWSDSAPTMTATNKYLWNYEIITYTDGTTSETGKRVIGVYGNTGSTGKGISSITEYYLASASGSGVTTSTSGWTTTVQTITTSKKYLWNYEVVTYTDNTTYVSTPVIIGTYGDKGDPGATGNGVKSSEVTYQASTSGTTIPTGTWSTSIPTVSAGSYLWTRTVITYTDGSTSTSYSVGMMGKTGSTGSAGKGISSTAITYQAGASGTSAPTGTWSTSVPTANASAPYVWTKTVITYTDGTASTSYSVGCTPEGIVIGGRNLLKNTKTMSKYELASNVTLSTDSEGFTVASFAAVDTLEWNYVITRPPIPFSSVRGKTVTFSVEIRSVDYESLNTDTSHGYVLVFALCTSNSSSRTLYRSTTGYKKVLSDNWQKIVWSATLTDDYFVLGSGTIDDTTRFYMQLYNYSVYSMEVRKFKLEFGNKATDWSPAPEDVEKGKMFYATSSTAAATAAKVATVASEAGNFELYSGATVAVKFTVTNTASSPTLNVNDTGAKSIYYRGSAISAGYLAANRTYLFCYNGAQWELIGDVNTDNNTYDRTKFNGAVKASEAITAGNIIVGNSSGYHHLKTGGTFDISYPILYAGSAITSANTGTNNYIMIPFTVATTQSITLTAYKAVYIKGKLSGTVFTPVGTAPLTQTIPTGIDGYYYLYLGMAYSTTAMYLMAEHSLYRYVAGAFRESSSIFYDLFADNITAKGTITGASIVGGTITSNISKTITTPKGHTADVSGTTQITGGMVSGQYNGTCSESGEDIVGEFSLGPEGVTAVITEGGMSSKYGFFLTSNGLILTSSANIASIDYNLMMRLMRTPIFICGTKVVTGTGAKYVSLFTKSDVQNMLTQRGATLGTNWVHYVTIVAINGDASTNSVNLTGIEWWASSYNSWWAYFEAAMSGSYRVNYTIIYDPNEGVLIG